MIVQRKSRAGIHPRTSLNLRGRDCVCDNVDEGSFSVWCVGVSVVERCAGWKRGMRHLTGYP